MKAKKAFEKIYNCEEKYRSKGEKLKEGIMWKLWNQIVDQYSKGPNVYFGDLEETEVKNLFSKLEQIELEEEALEIYQGASILLKLE